MMLTQCMIKEICSNPSARAALDVFLTEIERWRSLFRADNGVHVLPCLGGFIGINDNIGLVNSQPAQVNIIEYLRSHADLDVDRIAMIKHIAEGLKIMHEHSTQIIHGDLRAANIFINDQEKPIMTNLAFSADMYDTMNIKSNTVNETRNAAPELLESPEWRPTPASDIYAFAMTALEIFTEGLEFARAGAGSEMSTARVGYALFHEHLPERPGGVLYIERGLDDRMWELLLRCWSRAPEERPSIDEIITELSAP